MNVLVSSCFKYPTRYDGKTQDKAEMKKIIKLLRQHKITIIYTCPEQLGGLPTPRNPAEIVNDKVVDTNGNNVTCEFTKGAEQSLKIVKDKNIRLAILKEGSPSCGSNFIYDGTHQGRKKRGSGLTAKLLIENAVTVYSENDYKEIKQWVKTNVH